MVRKLQSKMNEETEHKFNLVRVIKAHLLPITNVAFNKLSTLFATGTSNKQGCVFPMVIWPAFRMEKYRVNDHPYHAPKFNQIPKYS